MKVLHVISSGGMYGAEAVILSLSAGMQARGHGSALGVFSNGPQANAELLGRARALGLEVHAIPCRGPFDRSVPGTLRSLCLSTGADLLHAHGYKADVYAWAATRSAGGVPLVSTCHTWYDNTPALRVYGMVDRWVLRSFGAVVAVSAAVRAQLLAAGVRAHAVHDIRNGVDPAPFADAPRLRAARRQIGGPLQVGLVGRLASEKGVDLFLRAAAETLKMQPDVQFRVVGDGPDREPLQALIAELGVADRVELAGRCEDMPALYAGLDLLVSASRQEGLPVALLEGMSSGLPLVATAVGEVPALLGDGEGGTLVPPGDVPALAAAITALLADPARRLRCGLAAAARVARDYSNDRMVEDYLAVYRTVLADPAQTTRQRAEPQ